MITRLLQKEKVKIICPNCKEEITEAWLCEMDSVIGLRYAYICSKCNKLIGVSDSKNYASLKISAENINTGLT